jgi:hypothetical protein
VESERSTLFRKIMNEYTIKIVANKVTLTSVLNPNFKQTFEDLNLMIMHVKKKGINIINPEVLPQAFQEQLKK